MVSPWWQTEVGGAPTSKPQTGFLSSPKCGSSLFSKEGPHLEQRLLCMFMTPTFADKQNKLKRGPFFGVEGKGLLPPSPLPHAPVCQCSGISSTTQNLLSTSYSVMKRVGHNDNVLREFQEQVICFLKFCPRWLGHTASCWINYIVSSSNFLALTCIHVHEGYLFESTFQEILIQSTFPYALALLNNEKWYYRIIYL